MPTRRALLTFIAAAAASACSAPPAAAVGSLVDMQIVDRSRGETLSTWRHRGTSYVAGRPGDRYAVRLTNRSPGRVLVVLSVDGVNAVSGDTAAVGADRLRARALRSRPRSPAGARATREAAAFYFTALPDSYAARTGRPDNVGVIGAAVFRERVPEPVGGWFRAGAAGRQGKRRRATACEASAQAAPAAADGATPPRRRRHAAAPRRARSWRRATRRSSAPATASANTRRRRRPPSSAPRRSRPRSCRCATTATPTCSRAASFRARGRRRASPTRSRRSFPTRADSRSSRAQKDQRRPRSFAALRTTGERSSCQTRSDVTGICSCSARAAEAGVVERVDDRVDRPPASRRSCRARRRP